MGPQLWRRAGVIHVMNTEIRQPGLAGRCLGRVPLGRSHRMRKSDSILSDEIPLIYKFVYARSYKLNYVAALLESEFLANFSGK